MSDKETIKEELLESLEENFISNKNSVEKEMNLLNILISSFGGDEYTYDEYCRKRMQYELESCDKVLDVDFDKDMNISNRDKLMIHNQVSRKLMENPNLDSEEVLKEEYISRQIQKCYEIDKKMYYQISKYSSTKLLENKIPNEVWNRKKEYFDEICETKAINCGNDTAEANKKMHEQDIRASMI